MSFAVGVWDWWNFRDRHTPQEWAVQIAADMVDPIGEQRADFRAAVNTVQVVMSMAGSPLNEAQITAIVNALRGYLPVNRADTTTHVGPAAIRQALGE